MPLFARQGKRLIGLTDCGQKVLAHAVEALRQTSNIVAVGSDALKQDRGVLRLGTTHTQARYVLPPVVRRFIAEYPEVELQVHQGTPTQLADLCRRDLIDLAICTEALAEDSDLETLPCYRWNRSLIAPAGHSVLQARSLTLSTLCEYPLITYVLGFTGRGRLSDTFNKAGLHPRIVLSAADSDVIKTYVLQGLGVGIIASMAFQSEQDEGVEVRDLSHLFPWEVTRIAYARDKYLRRFAQHFVEMFCAHSVVVESSLKPCG